MGGDCGVSRVGKEGWGRRGVKDGAGGNSDVIFESKLEFDLFGKSVQTHVSTAYCTYECYWSFS